MNVETTIERGAGDNAPPPHETFSMHVADMLVEARNFLDGEAIETEGQAEAISKLLSDARAVKGDAEKQRKVEKKPHDDAAAAVQTLWKPILEKADLVADTCKRALAPWLQRKDDEMRAVALAAAQEAEELAAAARALHEQAAPTDLAGREASEQALKDAGKAATAAARADRAKPQATGGSRAVGLRTNYRAEVTDAREFARWVWVNRQSEIVDFLIGLAEREVRASRAPMPGVTIHEDKVAV